MEKEGAASEVRPALSTQSFTYLRKQLRATHQKFCAFNGVRGFSIEKFDKLFSLKSALSKYLWTFYNNRKKLPSYKVTTLSIQWMKLIKSLFEEKLKFVKADWNSNESFRWKFWRIFT